MTDLGTIREYHEGRLIGDRVAVSDVWYLVKTKEGDIGRELSRIVLPGDTEYHITYQENFDRAKSNLGDKAILMGMGLGLLGSQHYLIGECVVHYHVGSPNGNGNNSREFLHILSDSHLSNEGLAKSIGLS